MSFKEQILEHPLVYAVWQKPFAMNKITLAITGKDIEESQLVLDVGCGPATVSHLFEGKKYLGVDINEAYIEKSKLRFPEFEFAVGDATNLSALYGRKFDFILVNSILHHLDNAQVESVLCGCKELLAAGGCLHILELVTAKNSQPLAKLLCKLDRGDYARKIVEWENLMSAHFRVLEKKPYPLGFSALGVPVLTLWNMIYFKLSLEN